MARRPWPEFRSCEWSVELLFINFGAAGHSGVVSGFEEAKAKESVN